MIRLNVYQFLDNDLKNNFYHNGLRSELFTAIYMEYDNEQKFENNYKLLMEVFDTSLGELLCWY